MKTLMFGFPRSLSNHIKLPVSLVPNHLLERALLNEENMDAFPTTTRTLTHPPMPTNPHVEIHDDPIQESPKTTACHLFLHPECDACFSRSRSSFGSSGPRGDSAGHAGRCRRAACTARRGARALRLVPLTEKFSLHQFAHFVR